MNKEESIKRDENGDIKLNIGKFDVERYRWWQYTYVFQHFDNERNHYFPYYDLMAHNEERLESARLQPDFTEMMLYQMPDSPPFDLFIHHNNWQLSLLVRYFKEVFEEQAFVRGYEPSNKFYRIILPKKLHDQILNTIKEFGLFKIRDLIFEIIAIAQDKYVDHIAFWEKPEMQKLVKSADKEAKKAIKIIEKTNDEKWLRGDNDAKKPADLIRINFVFNDETIKIEHAWLSKEFIEHFKSYYNDLAFKDWRQDLERYPDQFEDNIFDQQFKYRLAISFYNILSQEGFFVLVNEKYPNRLMLCIATLIEYCLIPVGTFDEAKDVKIKNVRNWLKRNDLKEGLTYLPVVPDRKRLLKYFSEDFLSLSSDTKSADVLNTGYYIGKRFEVGHLMEDISHIAQCLKEIRFIRGHQLLTGMLPFPSIFPDLTALQKLVASVKEKKKITSLKFKVEEDENEYVFTERLPFYFIEEALNGYLDDHSIEFDVDIVKTQIEHDSTGHFNFRREKNFNKPEERFLVLFVKAFYEYLLQEAPPKANDYIPSNKYYTIIAVLLQQTLFFNRFKHTEDFIVGKLKAWHKLS